MPPIVGTAIRSWRDAFQALRRMPLIFGIAIAALSIVDIATMALPAISKDMQPIAALVSLLQAGLYGIALVPLVIAMHRYVLLDEDGDNYAFDFRDLRFARFVRAELAYTALILVQVSSMLVLFRSMGKVSLAISIGWLFAVMAVTILALRLLILFPAIAVDAPAARWVNAWTDSRRLTWRLLGTVVLVGLPTIPFGWLHNIIPETHSLGRIALSLVGTIVAVFEVAAMAAVASHFFRSGAQRLIQPS
jgi:hypothetical protein